MCMLGVFSSFNDCISQPERQWDPIVQMCKWGHRDEDRMWFGFMLKRPAPSGCQQKSRAFGKLGQVTPVCLYHRDLSNGHGKTGLNFSLVLIKGDETVILNMVIKYMHSPNQGFTLSFCLVEVPQSPHMEEICLEFLCDQEAGVCGIQSWTLF